MVDTLEKLVLVANVEKKGKSKYDTILFELIELMKSRGQGENLQLYSGAKNNNSLEKSPLIKKNTKFSRLPSNLSTGKRIQKLVQGEIHNWILAAYMAAMIR